MLVDCGASTSVALRAHDVDPAAIDAIILSHLHGDHFGGIPLFLIDAQYHDAGASVRSSLPGRRARARASMPRSMCSFPARARANGGFPGA